MDAEKLIKHMAWANQEILSKVAEFPDQALDAYITNPEWTVREIARHIASSATWYGWRLLDKSALSEEEAAQWKAKLEETEIAPQVMADMKIALERLKAADRVLLEAARLPEAMLEHTMDGRTVMRARSTIISQSIHHSIEHRAQLVDALEFRGFTGINLDHYDVWGFSDTINE